MIACGKRTWIARLLVAAVFAMNMLCALQFILQPQTYMHAYQLSGPGAPAAVAGMGITFAMWNATYPPVIARPHRYRVLFGVVLAQQVIGLVGESALLLTLPEGLDTLSTSIGRFVAFDAAGLALLAIAWILTRRSRHAPQNNRQQAPQENA